MLLRQFSSRQPFLVIIGPVLSMFVLFPAYYFGLLHFSSTSFPLDQWLKGWEHIPWLLVTVASGLIFLGSLVINLIFNRHEFNLAPSYVPSFLYAILSTSLAMVEVSIPNLLANLFVIVGLNKQFEVWRQNRAIAEYFVASFCYGLAALAFPPFIWLSPGMALAVMNTRSFHWREHFLSIVAFVTPFVYWWSYLFFIDRLDTLILFRTVFSFNAPEGPDWNNNYILFFGIMIGLTFLFALRSFIFLSDRSSNRARSVKRIFLIMSIAMIGSGVFSYFILHEVTPGVILLPLGIVAGNWFTNYRYSLIAPFMFYGLILSCIALLLHIFGRI